MNLFRHTLFLAAVVAAAYVAPGCSSEPASDDVDSAATPPTAGQFVARVDTAGATAPLTPGRWHEMRPRPQPELSTDQEDAADRLGAVGYVAGSREAATNEILTAYDAERAYPGYNFFISGHGPEAYLADMYGVPLHKWRYAYGDIWSEPPSDRGPGNDEFWRRGCVFPNGDLLAIFEGLAIIKLDKDSNLLWAQHIGTHHDLQVLPNGDIVTLVRREVAHPDVQTDKPLLEDFFVVLTEEGQLKREVSVLECFKNSEFAELGLQRVGFGGDAFHTNTVNVLPPGEYLVPWLKEGYVLSSLRSISALAVFDLENETVVEAWKGEFDRQHDPTLVGGDRILLFDNTSRGNHSRIIEVYVRSREVARAYPGPQNFPLRSWTCGTVERLPNENTLITDSEQGRALEVDSRGNVVWEFFSPFRVGTDPEYIATLFEMQRLPEDFPTEWIAGSSGNLIKN